VSTRAGLDASPKPNNILQNVQDKIPVRQRNRKREARVLPQPRLAKRSAIQPNTEKMGFYAGLRLWNVLNGIPCSINDLSSFPVDQIR
jgi:hypothetical protein